VTVLRSVIVTIDGSDLALDAARQAASIADPQARILAVTVADGVPTHDLAAQPSRRPTEAAAAAALATAATTLPMAGAAARHVETEILHGFAPDVLVAVIHREAADLISVGMARRRRVEGFLTGDIATELLHAAPCSVLAGRADGGAARDLVVVGVDGSAPSAQALAAARHICRSHGGRLQLVAATGGKPIDLAAVRAMAGPDPLTVDTAGAVDALAAASADADLLVVGSRGLHGIRSLGSVSERIAHSSACSTLVYR
jgi:nucleotide-binding universal stress UspA family protein